MSTPNPAQTLLTTETAVGRWTLDPQRTQARIKHKTFWGLGTVTGVFPEVSGHGEISPGHDITGTVVIGAASIDTKNAKRDKHLRSADFFDVEAHPTFVVTVQSATAAGEHLDLHGELVVKGVHEPITLTAEITSHVDDVLAVHVTGTVDRHRFGVSANQLGMIKSISTLDVDAVFTRATA